MARKAENTQFNRKLGSPVFREWTATEGAVPWLREVANRFSMVLVEEGFLASDKSHTLAASAETMIADMVRNKVDVTNLSTSDLGVYAQPDACLQG